MYCFDRNLYPIKWFPKNLQYDSDDCQDLFLDAQIFYYMNPDTLSIQVWKTGQVPAFALLFATANFLNNFRKRYYNLKAKEKALGIAQKSDLQSQV